MHGEKNTIDERERDKEGKKQRKREREREREGERERGREREGGTVENIIAESQFRKNNYCIGKKIQ